MGNAVKAGKKIGDGPISVENALKSSPKQSVHVVPPVWSPFKKNNNDSGISDEGSECSSLDSTTRKNIENYSQEIKSSTDSLEREILFSVAQQALKPKSGLDKFEDQMLDSLTRDDDLLDDHIEVARKSSRHAKTSDSPNSVRLDVGTKFSKSESSSPCKQNSIRE